MNTKRKKSEGKLWLKNDLLKEIEVKWCMVRSHKNIVEQDEGGYIWLYKFDTQCTMECGYEIDRDELFWSCWWFVYFEGLERIIPKGTGELFDFQSQFE